MKNKINFLNKPEEKITLFEHLYKQNLFLTTGLPDLSLIDIRVLDERLKREDTKLLCNVLPKILKIYNSPAIIDIWMFLRVYKSLRLNEDQKILNSIKLSRISFLGTDGIRGKVSLLSGDFLKDFIEKNMLSCDLVENIVYVFCKQLKENNIVKENDYVCIGNDGRDKATLWKLKESLIRGIQRNSLKIYDLGIVPTPYVPYFSLAKDIRASIMLTASHNPSNQNGIKFFVNSKKILPEDKYGDYVISALLYKEYIEKKKKDKTLDLSSSSSSSKVKNINIQPIAIKGLRRLLNQLFDQKTLNAKLKEIQNDIIVLDTANGSYTDLAKKFLKELSINYVCINETPNGYNINKDCGVAEIEGYREFSKNEECSNKIVRKMFELVENYPEKNIYGVVLDGDGDRGMLLILNRKDKKIYVLDGDRCGYLLARYFVEHKNLKSAFFVSTVESDLMLSYYINKNLKLKTAVVSVGDKWICNFEKRFVVGVESSGHLIIPLKLEENKLLLTGNGLLTALSTLFVIKFLNLTLDEVVNPYPEGFSKTFYTYFVNKTLFYRDSEVWNRDKDIILKTFGEIKRKDKRLKDIILAEEIKEDRNMLYLSFKKKNELIGSIFIRNSGTEDKIATYCKSLKEFSDIFEKIGYLVNKNHINMMKNRSRIENFMESLIIEYLKKNSEIFLPKIKTLLLNKDKKLKDISDADLHNIIYAMRKEYLIRIEDNRIFLCGKN